MCGCSQGRPEFLYMGFLWGNPASSADLCVVLPCFSLIIKANSLVTHFQSNCTDIVCITSPASSSGMGVQESTAQQMVSDPTLVHVLVRFLSGGNPHGTSQHSSQVFILMNIHS